MELYKTEYNVFIIPIIVLVITRYIKFIIFYFKHNRDWEFARKHSMSYGHMPSVHTALMLSMVTTVGYYEGISSGAFAVAIIVATITIDDATRLRVYLGDLGKYINRLVEKTGVKSDEEFPHLKERMGHRVSEVIAGGFIGLILSLILIQLLS